MIVKILSYAAGLQDVLSVKLKEIGFMAETVDYSQELLPQHNNKSGTLLKSGMRAALRNRLVF